MSEYMNEPPEVEKSEREILEEMTTKQLADFILQNGEKVAEIERHMNLASEVLEAKGTSVEAVLDEREHERNKQS